MPPESALHILSTSVGLPFSHGTVLGPQLSWGSLFFKKKEKKKNPLFLCKVLAGVTRRSLGQNPCSVQMV